VGAQVMPRPGQAHRQQAGRALLHQGAIARGRQAEVHRRPRRAYAGVAGEGQFHHRGEDAHVVIRPGSRRQEEDRLGKIQPGRQGLHSCRRQVRGVDDHAQRVAGTGLVGKKRRSGDSGEQSSWGPWQ